MTYTVKPAKNQLFCKHDEAEAKTASGILLPSTATEAPKTATVINVGEDVLDFKPHDTIIYKDYTATEIKLNNDDFFLISVDDVLGTVIEANE